MGKNTESKFKAYKLYCVPTGKVYIGITTMSLSQRWAGHRAAALTQNTKLYRSIRKYGYDNFYLEHIASSIDLKSLLEIEVTLISQYDSMRSGLNSTLGGEGVLGSRHTTEAKTKMSEMLRARWSDPEYRRLAAINGSLSWDKRSEEDKERHREQAKINIQQAIKARRGRINIAKKSKKALYVGPGKGSNMSCKTHCPKGHVYSAENTYIDKRGSRNCKICKRMKRNSARDHIRLVWRFYYLYV